MDSVQSNKACSQQDCSETWTSLAVATRLGCGKAMPPKPAKDEHASNTLVVQNGAAIPRRSLYLFLTPASNIWSFGSITAPTNRGEGNPGICGVVAGEALEQAEV